MSIISRALHIVICRHHTDIHLTWAHVGGSWESCLGDNYREPTGGDWAAFCGLTFDCWVNGWMKIFNLLPEKRPKKLNSVNSDTRKQLERDMFITLTPFIALCICVCSSVCVCVFASFKTPTFQDQAVQTALYAWQPWHCVYTLWISRGEELVCMKKMLQS